MTKITMNEQQQQRHNHTMHNKNINRKQQQSQLKLFIIFTLLLVFNSKNIIILVECSNMIELDLSMLSSSPSSSVSRRQRRRFLNNNNHHSIEKQKKEEIFNSCNNNDDNDNNIVVDDTTTATTLESKIKKEKIINNNNDNFRLKKRLDLIIETAIPCNLYHIKSSKQMQQQQKQEMDPWNNNEYALRNHQEQIIKCYNNDGVDNDDKIVSCSSSASNNNNHNHNHIISTTTAINDNNSNSLDTLSEQNKKTTAWPPWPLNLLFNNDNNDEQQNQLQLNNNKKRRSILAYKSTAVVLYKYMEEKTLKTMEQIQTLTNAASFHLPPATIPLLLFSILPIANTNDNTINAMYMMHLWTKRFSYTALSIAILSWAEYVTNKQRLPSPIYINGVYDEHHDLKDYVLPPFLPECVPPPLLHTTTNTDNNNNDDDDEETTITPTNKINNNNNTTTTTNNKVQNIYHSLQGQLNNNDNNNNINNTIIQSIQKTYNSITKKTKTTCKKTKLKFKSYYTNRSTKSKYLHRIMIQQELLALQQLKQRHQQHKVKKNNVSNKSSNSYAMVVGASHGLGRALCIELARYSIPLILISRNETELKQLSYDIKTFYKIPCHVIVADLNNNNNCKNIFKTTNENKWNIDYFIYNSGVCYRNDITSLHDIQVERMMNVNMVSMTLLSKYYAASMKLRKKGRMLFISSIVGSIPSAPSVGIYAASKSYMTSYAYALAHELSSFGVTVTCCSPGAIKDTSFQTAAGSDHGNTNALCWKIPFYPKTPQEIAHRSIMGIIGSTSSNKSSTSTKLQQTLQQQQQQQHYVDVDIIPGWQNRILINFLQFVMSKRLMNVVIERCWNSWDFVRDKNDNDATTTTFLNDDHNNKNVIDNNNNHNVFSFDYNKLQSITASQIIRLKNDDDDDETQQSNDESSIATNVDGDNGKVEEKINVDLKNEILEKNHNSTKH